MKNIKLLNIPNPKELPENVIIRDGYAINNGFYYTEQSFFIPKQPYLLKDFRITYIVSGSASIMINLVKYDISAGDVLFIPSGSVVELQHVAENAYLKLFASEEYLLEQPIHVRSDKNTLSIFSKSFDLIDAMLRVSNCTYDSVLYVVSALVEVAKHYPNKDINRYNTRLNKFISLVNVHCSENRDISFYADKLCITSHYLSYFVKKHSGISVMDWINKAVVQRAKILLKQGKTTLQVAEELNFISPNYFNRYFKRHTSLTPSEYKKS